jgi:uncharacterized protein (DUF305 family)
MFLLRFEYARYAQEYQNFIENLDANLADQQVQYHFVQMMKEQPEQALAMIRCALYSNSVRAMTAFDEGTAKERKLESTMETVKKASDILRVVRSSVLRFVDLR